MLVMHSHFAMWVRGTNRDDAMASLTITVTGTSGIQKRRAATPLHQVGGTIELDSLPDGRELLKGAFSEGRDEAKKWRPKAPKSGVEAVSSSFARPVSPLVR
ncbi:protein of unknown function [Denitratisoma oestradiolicum]|uniref:Uncharacterized protein n=1 Tax=Denitratisoma oestradiolicum TaxID=311182 RepID=A0A6S6XQD0_9PROT|nr:protein of unknown function [Denitratisoma oestradiolicum]